ncbi:MAG: glycosyltransferase [Patescibacteria group bacterium]|nr:glycosyltransferase [Patescibacteria group bacterium]
MRIALVHDYLNQYGGAERVLETFAETFPDAPIYTLMYDREKTHNRFGDRVLGTSFLDHPVVNRNHRAFIPMMPLAASTLNLGKDYDVILSSSAGYGKGFRHQGDAVHIAYCHTPLRYAWENRRYFNWHPVMEAITAPAFWFLRKWDFRAGQRPDRMFANSHYIAGKIKQYYKRSADVLYPPVDLKMFYRDRKIKKQGYFLAVGRLMHYKKFDLIIRAFNRLNLPLIIIGDGPELENLKRMSHSSRISFLSFMDDDQLRTYYNGAEAVVFPQEEDFGLVAAEAQACGTPVIAFGQGGSREIVIDGVTGVLFQHQTVDDLALAVKKFLLSSFDEKKIRESARRFSKTRFKSQLAKIVESAHTA